MGFCVKTMCPTQCPVILYKHLTKTLTYDITDEQMSLIPGDMHAKRGFLDDYFWPPETEDHHYSFDCEKGESKNLVKYVLKHIAN